MADVKLASKDIKSYSISWVLKLNRDMEDTKEKGGKREELLGQQKRYNILALMKRLAVLILDSVISE